MVRRLALVLLFGLGACAVGPRYAPPKTAAADVWLEPQTPGAPDPAWWRGFNDPQLTELIALAEANSPDLKIAAARLAEARAGLSAARVAAGPQGEATASYARDEVSANGEIPINRIPGFHREFSLFDGGFDASWEVDLWGRQRHVIAGARARAQAAEAAGRATLLRLRAEVARDYLQLRAIQADLDDAHRAADAQRGLTELIAERTRAGEASRPDLERAEVQARAVAGAVPALEADEREAAIGVARLVGRPPEALAPTLLVGKPLPEAPDLLATGLRSDVLRRRPDVIEAERNLAAATADQGVAVADLFPRLLLTGAVGQQSLSLNDIAQGASGRFAAGPTVSWPILQRGVIRAQIRAANARTQAASAAFEAAVLAALSDSEAALSRFARAAEVEREAAAGQEASNAALVQVRERRAAGEDDRGAVLAAQAAEVDAERRLTDARLARAIAAVSAWKALGF